MESFSSTRGQHSEAICDIHVNAEVHTNDLQKLGKHAIRAAAEEVQPCSRTIAAYLRERGEEFRELSELRQKGWNSQGGDRFFENQRRVVDRSDTRTAQYFYAMMQNIAKQLLSAIGSPQTVADIMETWIKEADTDGFNISYATTPGTFEVVKFLWPELKRRGVLQTSWMEGRSMRENFLQDEKGPKAREGHPARSFR